MSGGNSTNVFFGRVAGALPDALGMAGSDGGVGDARACCIGLETLCCCQCLQCGACAAAVFYFVDDVLSSSGGKLLAPLFAGTKKTKTNNDTADGNESAFVFGDSDDDDDGCAAPHTTYNEWASRCQHSSEPRDEKRDGTRIGGGASAEPQATNSPSRYGQWLERQ